MKGSVPQLQLDILSVVVRIEQAHADPDLAEFLLDRLATCDAPRLRRHLTPETLAWEAEMRAMDSRTCGCDAGGRVDCREHMTMITDGSRRPPFARGGVVKADPADPGEES